MAKPKLAALTIRPGANGGHTVTHEFEAKPAHSRGARGGGLYMDRPASEDHNFGAGEGQSMLKHVAEALALKQQAPQEPEE